MENEESLSEEDESVQTSKRLKCPPKATVKVNKMTSKTSQAKKK